METGSDVEAFCVGLETKGVLAPNVGLSDRRLYRSMNRSRTW